MRLCKASLRGAFSPGSSAIDDALRRPGRQRPGLGGRDRPANRHPDHGQAPGATDERGYRLEVYGGAVQLHSLERLEMNVRWAIKHNQPSATAQSGHPVTVGGNMQRGVCGGRRVRSRMGPGG